MKLVPRQRFPISSLRSREAPLEERGERRRHTPVTMDKRGGMASAEREEPGVPLGLGSRFRVPERDSERVQVGPGPAARPYRVSVQVENRSQRLLGLPLLRLEVEVKRRGQAYRVLEPSSSRFRMRFRDGGAAQPDPRFTMAGRGGPKVMLDEEPDEE
jgi:hypothetical protein